MEPLRPKCGQVNKRLLFFSKCKQTCFSGVENLDLYNKLELPKTQPKRRVKERLKPYVKDPYACDLIDKLLWLDPSKRIDADAALNHDFFWTDPMPCSLEKMLSNHAQSMFEYLAPRRGCGGGGGGGGGGGANVGGPGGAGGGQNHSHGGKAVGHHDGYKDTIY